MISNTRIKIDTKSNLFTKSISDFFCGEVVCCADTQEIYVCNGNTFVKLVDNQQAAEVKSEKILRPHICQCCGAPLHSNTCEYCGVEYK